MAEEEDFNLCLEFPEEIQNQIDTYLKNGHDQIFKEGVALPAPYPKEGYDYNSPDELKCIY